MIKNILSVIWVIILLGCQDSNLKIPDQPDDDTDLIVKSYDVSTIRSIMSFPQGFRPLFEKHGIELDLDESIHDSAPTSMLIIRAKSATHRKIELLLSEIVNSRKQ